MPLLDPFCLLFAFMYSLDEYALIDDHHVFISILFIIRQYQGHHQKIVKELLSRGPLLPSVNSKFSSKQFNAYIIWFISVILIGVIDSLQLILFFAHVHNRLFSPYCFLAYLEPFHFRAFLLQVCALSLSLTCMPFFYKIFGRYWHLI